MDVWTLKVISIPLISVINFISGFIPFFYISRNMKLIQRQSAHFAIISPAMKRFLSLGNFFSAGVFLSTCFIGLYPGVNSKFNNIIRRNSTIRNYPYAGLSVAAGFFLVWFLEVLVHACIHCHSHASHDNDQGQGHDHDHIHYHKDDHNHDHVDVHDHDHDKDHIHYHKDNHDHDHMHDHDHVDDHDQMTHHDHYNDHIHDHDHSHDHMVDHDSITPVIVTVSNKNQGSVKKTKPLKLIQLNSEDKLLSNCEDEINKRDQEEVVVEEDREPHSHIPISGNVLGSIMLTFALGSHSLIEGLGFGVLDDISTVINMLVTMVIHESICAISLGVNIASKKTPLKVAIVLIIIFSILIPLGIGLGLIVNIGIYKNLTGEVVTAVLQGVAAGTFVYVVFMEILPNEISTRSDQWLRIFIMLLGFAVIAAMKATHSDAESSSSLNVSLSSSRAPLTHTH